MTYKHLLFDWGNTLMEDMPQQQGPMYLWPDIAVVENAAKVLAQLSTQYQCHIATNAHDSSVAEIRMALKRGGIDNYIREIFCYQRIGHKKPQTDFFRYVTNTLQSPLIEIVMIGDSLENDVIGALNAGLDAIWFNRKNAACSGNVRSVKRLEDLLPLFNE